MPRQGNDTRDRKCRPRRFDTKNRCIVIIHRTIVDDKPRRAEIDIGSDRNNLASSADEIGARPIRPYRYAPCIRRLMRGDDGRLVVRLAVADGPELLIGDK